MFGGLLQDSSIFILFFFSFFLLFLFSYITTVTGLPSHVMADFITLLYVYIASIYVSVYSRYICMCIYASIFLLCMLIFLLQNFFFLFLTMLPSLLRAMGLPIVFAE